MKKTLSLLALFVVMGPAAHAGIMLEPFVGYNMGKIKCETNAGSDCSGDSTATAYGLRAGYKTIMGLWVAGEYAGDTGGKYEPDAAGSTSSDFKHSSLGVTAGFDILMGLRLFAGYNFQEKVETTSGGTTSTYDGGNSVKFGAGYKLPMIPLAFNFELYQATYKDFKSGAISGALDTYYNTFKASGYMLSISAPFDF